MATVESRSEKIDVMKYVLNKLEVTNHNEVLMVGDRMYDINASNELGIDSVGVLFGFGSYEEFEKARATYIVNNALEILNILKK
jgi:phosphoglycolate phosphatase